MHERNKTHEKLQRKLTMMAIVHRQMDMLNMAGTTEESDYLFAEELMRGDTAHKAALMVTDGDAKTIKHSASRRGVPAIVRSSHQQHTSAGGMYSSWHAVSFAFEVLPISTTDRIMQYQNKTMTLM